MLKKFSFCSIEAPSHVCDELLLTLVFFVLSNGRFVTGLENSNLTFTKAFWCFFFVNEKCLFFCFRFLNSVESIIRLDIILLNGFIEPIISLLFFIHLGLFRFLIASALFMRGCSEIVNFNC